MEHLKLLLPRWKIKCAFKLAGVKNCLPHIEHLFIGADGADLDALGDRTLKPGGPDLTTAPGFTGDRTPTLGGDRTTGPTLGGDRTAAPTFAGDRTTGPTLAGDRTKTGGVGDALVLVVFTRLWWFPLTFLVVGSPLDSCKLCESMCLLRLHS